ncbi:hypothetical protein AWC15_12150 [Mycobacterium lacus]|uniref:Uncharacterized protein n=1 Tax=Mycobacterium lacus TaxID=169765 RepID=A0A1X1YV26_9MYCO|nr:hypothetical protein AWC15_12150 [Mycobacterium lacus]BBX95070.1 hypothetical protein MLAC_03640 [Mycobacterium lacus]
MHDVVVLFDLDEVDGIAETRCLEEVAGISPQHLHLGQLAPIALEMPVVASVVNSRTSASVTSTDFTNS